MASDEIYEFGGFTLDVLERRVSDGRQPIALAPKAFDLLVALIRRAGHLTSKQDLLERVWSEAYVEEGILAVHVSALRKALRDTQRPASFIETVPRSGYRFVAPVRRRANVAAPAPALPDDRPAEPPSSRTAPSLLDVLPARPLTPAGAVGAATAARPTPEVYELCAIGREHLLAASMFEVPRAVEAFRAAMRSTRRTAPRTPVSRSPIAHRPRCGSRRQPTRIGTRDRRHCARSQSIRTQMTPQVALGTVLFLGEWDWDGAERSLRRALEINPAHVQGYVIYGRLLDALGRPREAMDVKLRAFERDPLSPIAPVQLALSCWNQRRYDDAIEWANKALRIDPRHLLAREFLAGAYFRSRISRSIWRHRSSTRRSRARRRMRCSRLRTRTVQTAGTASFDRCCNWWNAIRARRRFNSRCSLLSPATSTPPSVTSIVRSTCTTRRSSIWRSRRSGTGCAPILGSRVAWRGSVCRHDKRGERREVRGDEGNEDS